MDPLAPRTPRGTRPDAVTDDVAHLIKATDQLRLTYQIRLLALMASQEGLRLEIHVRPETRISVPLTAFVEQHRSFLSIKRPQ